MATQTDTSVMVQAVTDVPATSIFAVLADTARHPDIDGSGMLRGVGEPHTITGVGDVFTMEMTYPALGDYRTDNHVVEFEPDRRISWTVAREGQPVAGVWWTWDLSGVDGATLVTHIYDWSRVSDPAVLERVSFPRVQPEEMQASVERLIALAGRLDP